MEHIVSVPLVSNLKSQPGNTENTIMTLGAITKGDGLGKFYYFDKNDNTTAEDMVNYNVIVPNTGGGRWKAVFTRMIALPHGILSIQSGLKQFFYTGVTALDGTCTVNLTLDGTSNGTPIFSTVFFDDSKANINITNIADAVSSCRKTLSADNKVLVHQFFRGNSTVVSILGANIIAFRAAAQNTAVSFSISGK